jgi:tetratricopeptide (TPR) repeat protein
MNSVQLWIAILLVSSLAALAQASDMTATYATADDAAAQARQAAQANRHGESIALFQAALAAAPARRGEWLVEFADQHAWSGNLREAIALYREAIAISPPDQHRRARVGLARALSWSGAHSNALEQYATVLRDHPDDQDARRGAARVESWLGRQRRAAARMQNYLKDHPNDREATEILADALNWMGRSDRAAEVLRGQVAADSQHERATMMLSSIERYQRPETSFDWRDFDQSDDLGVRQADLSVRLPFANGRGDFRPRYVAANYRPPSGPVTEIDVQRSGFAARYRLSDSIDWNGSVFLDQIDTRGSPGDHEHLTYDTYVTYWPNDLLRFDLGSSRWTFDSEQTLREGLTATQVSASMDVTPDDRTRFAARMSRADYSDNNRRDWWQLQAERRVWDRPRTTLGIRHTRFDFTAPSRGGYYNPAGYRSTEALLDASGWIVGRAYWSVRLAVGRENEQGVDPKRIRSGSASLGWQALPSLELELAYDRSSSRTAAASGFERSIARATVRYRF